MGLDNSLYATKNTVSEHWNYDADDLALEIYSGRNQSYLHDWMQRLFLAKGGSTHDRHFGAVVLNHSDLDQLEADIKARNPSNDCEAKNGYTYLNQILDITLIDKARRALAMNLTVLYTGS